MRINEILNEGQSIKKINLSDLDYYLRHPEQITDEQFKEEFGMTRAQAIERFGDHMESDDDDDDVTYYLEHPEDITDSQFKLKFGMTRDQAKKLFYPEDISDDEFETEFGMSKDDFPDEPSEEDDFVYYANHEEEMSDDEFESKYGMTREQAHRKINSKLSWLHENNKPRKNKGA